MTTAEPPRPVLDPSVLDALAAELDSRACALSYARMFAQLLAERVARIHTELADPDPRAALEATLSLKVNSAMIGCLRVTSVAETLEAALRAGDGDAAVGICQALDREVPALRAALNALLTEQPRP